MNPSRFATAMVATLTFLLFAVPAGALETGEEPEPAGEGSERIAGAVAAEFGISEEAALGLHGAGIGWGGVFKLGLLSAVTGEDVESLLASAVFGEDGEFEFSWGEWFASLQESQVSELDGFARNLGQLVSASRRGHGRPEHAGIPAFEREDHPGNGHLGEGHPGKGPGGGHPGKGHSGEEEPEEPTD